MFTRVLSLILNAANKPADNRSAEETREDVLHVLGTLKRFKTQPHLDGLVDPAIRFIGSSAWSLLWARIRIHQGRPFGSQNAAELDQALKDYFYPLLEEIADGR